MLKLRKGPICPGIKDDGRPCQTRVGRPGEQCLACLERRATSADVECRRQLAEEATLPGAIFELLGTDADDEVRLVVAGRHDCPLIVLQELEHDPHHAVRSAAAHRLSTAFMPRVLHEPEAGNLFTLAELDALGQQDTATSIDPFDHRAPAERAHAAAAVPGAAAPHVPDDGLLAGVDDILSRLDGLSRRLSSLEAALASTGERLVAISGRLDGLGDDADHAGRADPARHRAERQPSADGPVPRPAATGTLLPVVHPTELGSGPVIRTDIVAAAWLAVLPLLARHRERTRGLGVTIPAEAVAGPFTGAATAVAELLPGARPSAHPASDALSPARREERLWRRRHAAHARRRGSRR